jgi:hypothetical protein
VDAQRLAQLQALGRIALGGWLIAAPASLGGGWVGGVADRRAGQTLAIGLGARDLALGIGQLGTAGRRRGGAARPWIRAGIVADLGDLLGTLRAREELPPLAVPTVAAIAGGSALLGAWLQASVE